MKAKEVRDLSSDELAVKEREVSESLTILRLRARTSQIESPARLKQLRRELARIKTIQRERQPQERE
ncbi:MAG TPA: 50S ribosomal protein L29 [Terriglobales bacterium]|nr:50S ribosomal protein L29 [Terriglobales bacterium]